MLRAAGTRPMRELQLMITASGCSPSVYHAAACRPVMCAPPHSTEVPPLPRRLRWLAAVLRNQPSVQARNLCLVRVGNRLPRASLTQLGEETRVPGCTSVVHVRARKSADGRLGLTGAADSRIARGLVTLLARGLWNEPADVLECLSARQVAEACWLQSVLVASRLNGIDNMLAVMRAQIEADRADAEDAAAHPPTPPIARPEALASTLQLADEPQTAPWEEPSAAWPHAKEEVAVLLSGGVDSSVALRRLQEQGHKVRAFYLRIWLEDEQAEAARGACPWEEDWRYCEAVCREAGVPLESVSLQREYSEQVVGYLVAEAAAGRTPNPDIMCNSRIKFGVFHSRVGRHFHRVASGHYAQTAPLAGGDGEVQLLRSADAHKDQTYFLSQLHQEQLRDTIFPIGGLSKPEVTRQRPDGEGAPPAARAGRRLACVTACVTALRTSMLGVTHLMSACHLHKTGGHGHTDPSLATQVRAHAERLALPNRARKDSQGICFLGQLNYDDFLRSHLGERPGDIYEEETGHLIGTHHGLWFHTVGQRRGLGPVLSNAYRAKGPWHVVRKDIPSNTLYASRSYNAADKVRDSFEARAINWVAGQPPWASTIAMPMQVKVRHGEHIHQAVVTLSESGGAAHVQLTERDKGLAPGQFAAFYDGEVCLGSGVICE